MLSRVSSDGTRKPSAAKVAVLSGFVSVKFQRFAAVKTHAPGIKTAFSASIRAFANPSSPNIKKVTPDSSVPSELARAA